MNKRASAVAGPEAERDSTEEWPFSSALPTASNERRCMARSLLGYLRSSRLGSAPDSNRSWLVAPLQGSDAHRALGMREQLGGNAAGVPHTVHTQRTAV